MITRAIVCHRQNFHNEFVIQNASACLPVWMKSELINILIKQVITGHHKNFDRLLLSSSNSPATSHQSCK